VPACLMLSAHASRLPGLAAEMQQAVAALVRTFRADSRRWSRSLDARSPHYPALVLLRSERHVSAGRCGRDLRRDLITVSQRTGRWNRLALGRRSDGYPASCATVGSVRHWRYFVWWRQLALTRLMGSMLFEVSPRSADLRGGIFSPDCCGTPWKLSARRRAARSIRWKQSAQSKASRPGQERPTSESAKMPLTARYPLSWLACQKSPNRPSAAHSG